MPADRPTISLRTLTTAKGQKLVFRKYRLRVHGSGRKGQEWLLDTPRATVGTAAANEVVIADPRVSRTHCEIVVDEHGYLVRDLESKNGTSVDGLRVQGCYLKPDSVIGIGDVLLVFLPAEEQAQVALAGADRFGKLVGGSLEMRALFANLERIATQDATVLIEGETGTGKEIVASEIHAHSRRKGAPLVTMDCGSIAENLAESALFGHVKGAFTGASADREGAFREANGGTLFLDEIGELPLELQPKLLRALEAREVKPVGGATSVKVDVRILAATNRDLADEVRKGTFRQDLFFRLDVMRVRVPPLRHRRGDVPLLVETLLARNRPVRRGVETPRIAEEVLAMLASYSWPGNVRELRNFVERYLVFTPTGVAGAVELLSGASPGDASRAEQPLLRLDLPFKEAKERLVEALEVEYFRRLLVKTKGNVSAAAREAGIHRKYLEILVKKHQLKS